MGARIPLGSAEGQRLEFKSSEALRKPLSISREVVAMLNAGGGESEIWVGVREVNGRAVEVEDLQDVERKREDLLNHLIEVIEPRLRPDDARVEVVEHGDGKRVLCVRVRPRQDRGPFAQLKEGGRHYLIRVDHRIRPMTREEVFTSGSSDKKQKATERLTELRDAVLKGDRSGMWIGILPSPELALDVHEKELASLLLDPSRSGSRESGWNFRFPQILQVPMKVRRKLEYGSEENKKTTIWKDGCIEFWTSIGGLRHRMDSVKEIYPLALLEYSTSIMRLAKAVYASFGETRPVEVFVDLALTRAEGWHLPSYAPDTYGYAFEHEPPRELDDGQSLSESPVTVPWEAFEKTPDHAGYLLVRALYRDFGLPEDRIPKQYDRIARRLVFER